MPRPSRTLRARRSAVHSQPTAGRLADSALPDNSPIRVQLERICGSRLFSGANRSQLFLRYVVEHSVAHPTEPLKEYSVALDVFDRDASYDPAIDATVRVEAGRLRSRLLEYYAGEGHADPLLIEIPRGGYRAVISRRRAATVPLPRPFKLMPAAAPRLSHLLAIPAAFILGALLGRRASH